MHTKLLQSFIIIFALLNMFLVAHPAVAHGDEPRLEISAESLNPGDLLEIRGVDFEFEEEIALSLVGLESELPLGVVNADPEGIFQLSVTLPVDLVAGAYAVRAMTDDHVIESSPINIWGSADLGGGEEGAREEEDGLLAPMPTAIPVVAGTVEQAALQTEEVPAQNSVPSLVWVLAVVAVILIVAVIRVLQTRRSYIVPHN